MKEFSNNHLPEQNNLKIVENQVNTIDLIKEIISDPVSGGDLRIKLFIFLNKKKSI